jgi:hypothetical protein
MTDIKLCFHLSEALSSTFRPLEKGVSVYAVCPCMRTQHVSRHYISYSIAESSRQEDINLSLDLLHKRVWQHDCHHSLIARETKTIAYFSCAPISCHSQIICWQHLFSHRSVRHRTVSVQTSKVVRKQLKKTDGRNPAHRALMWSASLSSASSSIFQKSSHPSL